MSTTNIYVIRHGESQGNRLDKFLGHTDLDLTETGHAQAELTANFLKDIPVDAIYSSDLMRAYHTALHTAEMVGLPVIKSEKLREVYAGDWENRTFADLHENCKESFTLWCENIGVAKCDNGESVVDVQRRACAELERIVRENEGKTIFVFTHATTLRTLVAGWKGLAPEQIKDIPWASNASVTHAQCVDGQYTVLEYSIDHFMGSMATFLPDSC